MLIQTTSGSEYPSYIAKVGLDIEKESFVSTPRKKEVKVFTQEEAVKWLPIVYKMYPTAVLVDSKV